MTLHSRLSSLVLGGAALAGALGPAPTVHAQAATNYIFVCTTAQGRRLTSDRLIAECNDRQQQVYSRDGVLIRTVEPSLTAAERAVVEAKRAKEQAEQDAKAELVRRDRQLLARFSAERSHTVARDAALGPVNNATRAAEARLAELAVERKPLLSEAEFYAGKALPLKLRQQLSAVDGAETALRTSLKVQDDERKRINEMYDIELERLRKLWTGAAPGSLGPMREPVLLGTALASVDAPAPASITTAPAAAVPAQTTPVSTTTARGQAPKRAEPTSVSAPADKPAVARDKPAAASPPIAAETAMPPPARATGGGGNVN